MSQIVGKRYYQKNKKEPVVGIELTTGRISSSNSLNLSSSFYPFSCAV